MTQPAPTGGPSLSALFAQHKPVVLGVAAAGVIGMALLKKKTSTTSSSASSPAGTIPAAAVIPSSSVQGTYPASTATDVINSLQPTLAQILQQQSGQTSAGNAAPLTAPKPIASTLFAPSGSGQYLRYGSLIGEVQQDGSLYSLTYPEWAALQAKGASYQQVSDTPGAMPKAWTGQANIAQRADSFTTPGSPPPPTVKA